MLVSGCDPGGREVESLPARHFSVRSLFFSPIANAELWKLVSLCRDDHLPRVRRYLGPLIMLPMPEVVFVQASEYASQAAQTGHKHSQDQRLQHCCHSAGTALSVAAQRQGLRVNCSTLSLEDGQFLRPCRAAQHPHQL